MSVCTMYRNTSSKLAGHKSHEDDVVRSQACSRPVIDPRHAQTFTPCKAGRMRLGEQPVRLHIETAVMCECVVHLTEAVDAAATPEAADTKYMYRSTIYPTRCAVIPTQKKRHAPYHTQKPSHIVESRHQPTSHTAASGLKLKLEVLRGLATRDVI